MVTNFTRNDSLCFQVGPDKVEAMIGLDHKYKGFYRLYFAPWQRAVMVSDPKCAKEVLKTSCKCFP